MSHNNLWKSLALFPSAEEDLNSDGEDDVMDLETIATCFPNLKYLSLCYDLRDGLLQCGIRGSSLLENVVVMELGSTVSNDLFTQWIAAILETRGILCTLIHVNHINTRVIKS